jgi:hypothetical protein
MERVGDADNYIRVLDTSNSFQTSEVEIKLFPGLHQVPYYEDMGE